MLVSCASNPAPTPKSKPAPSAKSAPKKSKQARKPPPKKSAPNSGSRARPAAPAPPAVAKSDRNFLRPVLGPVIAQFDGRSNKGIDFAGAPGNPVHAARDGRIAYSGLGPRGYGQLVMIQHGATFLTAYAHNSHLLVKEGQSVKKGQVIARMGSTETDRVKLHFELRRNGTAVDPAQYFEAPPVGRGQ
jgi:lipoprotein NlpD